MQCRSVLIVEDDEVIRTTLQELLQFEGYNTYGAIHGKEAFELLDRIETPCLILLDLMMPVMSGWEFSKIKQQNVRIAPIPVVIVSAIETDKSAIHAVEFVKKPIDFSVLLRVVREYCGMPIP